MPDHDAADSHPQRATVFLSYASQDREAARLLRDALPGFGLEVWYDESELGGGEAWDQKIRRQIRECDYFMPVVSAQTEARLEAYFRREWRLAVERTLDMADDRLFLLPVVIDDTDQAVARVPERFLTVQWLKIPGGRSTRALEALCHRIASGNVNDAKPAKAASRNPARGVPRPVQNPEFPREEPGQRIRFWVDVLAWGFRSLWRLFRRLPRWLRALAYVWIAIALVSHFTSSKHRHPAEVSPAEIQKLKTIANSYQGSSNGSDISKLGTQIAKEFADDSDEAPADGPLLAIPFSAPAGDPTATKFANATFAMAYGMISLSHRGQVTLVREPLSSNDLAAAVERGKTMHATYVLFGTINVGDAAQVLTVKIATVADRSVVWSKSYPAAGTDPATIAAEVNGNIPALTST